MHVLNAAFDEALETFERKVASFIKTLKADEAVLVFSGPDNFRKDVWDGYKAHRKATRKPLCYWAVIDHLAASSTYKVVSERVLEGDDYIGILATRSSNYERIIDSYQSASIIALDIETGKEPYIHITEVGYTAIWITAGKLVSHSCVVQLDSLSKLAIIRQLNDLPAAKVMQNGKYDCAYLARYNAIPRNYLWDTATLMHCWYSELPKDLGFLGAFFSRSAMYWKDLAKSGNKRDQLLYNCKDTYTTALAFLQMIKEIPTYAKQNYLSEFPLLFPCHMAEMTGIARDATNHAVYFQFMYLVI